MNAPNLAQPPQVNPGLTPKMLSHAAWVTHDVEATANFYMHIMGMELATTIMGASVPSTGDDFPYFHIFFRMADGSTIAFFEVPGLPERPEPIHPAYDVFDHIALQVSDRAEVDRWYEWLVANGIDVVGPTDHGIIYSIYFHDPNGMRLEITTPTDPHWNNHTEKGKRDLALWCQGKKDAIEKGIDLSAAMTALIISNSKRGR
jgi:catechol-2,3-dioxygenase